MARITVPAYVTLKGVSREIGKVVYDSSMGCAEVIAYDVTMFEDKKETK
jgi:hypothetical protein